ncbi:MAG: toxin-antitoxin system YwqK family antitoxin [Vicingaceae bacterium]
MANFYSEVCQMVKVFAIFKVNLQHMRSLVFFVILSFLSFNSIAQSYDLVNGDTINKIDVNNKRQGKWVIKANPPKDKGYRAGAIVEEGNYNGSRKFGLWKTYYPNGNLKSEITYKGSRPFGPYTLYYENGNVEEKGNWARTKNTGSFKRYHENGKIAQDFSFTEGGKRTGKQKYFYANGNLRLEGTWNEGLESGEMREYYENGDLMAVKNFNEGEMDKNSYQSFAPKTPQKDPLEKQLAEGKDMTVKASSSDKPNQGGFNGNGYKKLFNQNRQISKDGVFKNYRLIDGKDYQYDDNGLLERILIFKGGKYIGDGVIEEDA